VKWQKGGWCRVERLRKEESITHITHVKTQRGILQRHTLLVFSFEVMSRDLSEKAHTIRLPRRKGGYVCRLNTAAKRRVFFALIAHASRTLEIICSVVSTDSIYTSNPAKLYMHECVIRIIWHLPSRWMTPRYLSKQLTEKNGTAEFYFARSNFSKSIYNTRKVLHAGLNFEIHIRVVRNKNEYSRIFAAYVYLQWNIIEFVRGQIKMWYEMRDIV